MINKKKMKNALNVVLYLSKKEGLGEELGVFSNMMFACLVNYKTN